MITQFFLFIKHHHRKLLLGFLLPIFLRPCTRSCWFSTPWLVISMTFIVWQDKCEIGSSQNNGPPIPHISSAIKRCHLSFNFSQKVSSLKAFKNVNCICLRKRWFTSSLDELLLHTPYDTQQIILNRCRKRNYKFYIVANVKKPPLVFLLSFFLMRFEFFSVWSFSLGWWFCV